MFRHYAAVFTLKHPDRIQDLLDYQSLIVEVCMEYICDAWLGYDHCFWQNAAASPNIAWAKIDPTLWNKAFTGQARAQRCQFCFSLTHKSEDRDRANAPSTSHASESMPASTSTKPIPPPQTTKICYARNDSPEAACPFPNCSYMYQHICLYCTYDNQIIHNPTKRYTAGAN